MSRSVFEVFQPGIGPSSSHTMGPMRAAHRFAAMLVERELRERVERIRIDLYGSLASTGKGHYTDVATFTGLQGALPETVRPDEFASGAALVRASRCLGLMGGPPVAFDERRDLLFHPAETHSRHPNALTFSAFGAGGAPLLEETYYSVGGGRVCNGPETVLIPPAPAVPYPYRTAAELLERCSAAGLTIAELAFANECAGAEASMVRARLIGLWSAMRDCIERGLAADGALPGGLGTPRRARQLLADAESSALGSRHMGELRRVSAWACAVSEENAAGGRMVTAPTNGAAGVVPAVLMFYERCCEDASEQGIVGFLLAAGVIGGLYIENASISGAEVGCQGEVGVACSMAAAGLAAALGGSNEQIEYAAEIGMEHNLGLTCDPVGGLVQVPCIERNAVAAVKAISAAQLALSGDGSHLVSLDRVIEVMRQTGADMHRKYKETAEGGLTVRTVAMPIIKRSAAA